MHRSKTLTKLSIKRVWRTMRSGSTQGRLKVRWCTCSSRMLMWLKRVQLCLFRTASSSE